MLRRQRVGRSWWKKVATGSAILQVALSGSVLAADSPLVMRFDSGFDDSASALATDSLGNAYVGGYVESVDHELELATLKYDATGALLWTAKYLNSQHGTDYGTVHSIAADAAGNVYVAGQVYTSITPFLHNMDWLVASYAPNGVERWSHRINGTANGFDSAGDVAVDASGNVYVTGSVDDAANAGRAGWTLIKYSSNGTVLWRRTDVRDDGIRDALSNLSFDAAGNLVGSSSVFTQSFPQHKIVTTKVDPNGNVLWRRLFSDTALSDDVFADMDMDAGGNIYVTGETVLSTNPELEHVPITLKYSADGTLQYVLRGDGAGGTSVAVDASGDFVLSGSSVREGGGAGLTATAKYDAAGNRQWLTSGVAGDLAIDNVGNVYASSTIQLFTANRSDLQTVKLNGDGTLAWQHRYDGTLPITSGSADWSVASTVDPFGNLFVVGNAQDGIFDDIVTLRYAANVTPQQPPASIRAPTNLTATAQSGRVVLSWSDNADNEAGFGIERCLGKNCGNFAAIAQVSSNSRSFADTSVSNRSTYRYRVRAAAQTVVSPYSNIATVTTPRK